MTVFLASCFLIIIFLSQGWGKQYLVETESEERHRRHYHHGSEVGEDYGDGEGNDNIGSLIYESLSKEAKHVFDEMLSNTEKEELIEKVKNAIYGEGDYNDLGTIKEILQINNRSMNLLDEISDILTSVSVNQREAIGVKTTTENGSKSEKGKIMQAARTELSQ